MSEIPEYETMVEAYVSSLLLLAVNKRLISYTCEEGNGLTWTRQGSLSSGVSIAIAYRERYVSCSLAVSTSWELCPSLVTALKLPHFLKCLLSCSLCRQYKCCILSWSNSRALLYCSEVRDISGSMTNRLIRQCTQKIRNHVHIT